MEDETSSFVDLGLKPWLVNQISAISISSPTPVQRACIPAILQGKDVVGCAQTGSGKTLAFALPIMNRLMDDPVGPYALVVSPTRELAFQIADQLQVLCKALNFRLLVVTGGRDIVQQGRELAEKPHFIVATPGRMADHLKHTTDFSLRTVRFLVLDEVDRLLEDNFGDDLGLIIGSLPKKRQSLLFSATFTPAVSTAIKAATNSEPFVFKASDSSDARVPETLSQHYCLVPAQVKDAFLIHIVADFLKKNPNSLIIIFTNKCKWCHLLGLMFRAMGHETVLLHSSLSQRVRLQSLAKFKSNQVRVLISTDVGSRGLDIPLVDLVINHNVPTRAKDYVHRCGRTARAGRTGLAITLANQFEIELLKSVEQLIGTSLTEYDVNESEIAKIVSDVVVARREAEIRLDESKFDEKREERKEKQRFMAYQRQAESQEQADSVTKELNVADTDKKRLSKTPQTASARKKQKREVDE